MLSASPRVLHDGRVAHVLHLGGDVDFAHPIDPLLWRNLLFGQGTLLVDVLDVTEPVVDETMRLAPERGGNASATVVATDDDVSYFECLDGVLQHREAIQIGVRDDVRDVSVDENLAGHETNDLVCRNSAVRTSDPEIGRSLLLREIGEELGVLLAHLACPIAIAFEEVLELLHED